MTLPSAIEAAGYGITGNIGGIKKTTYYTPDGRTFRLPPCIRDFVRKDRNGNLIESGTRDANLDKGWLLQMPQEKKPYCRTCDGWHDDDTQVRECAKRQRLFIVKEEVKAKKEESDKTTSLEMKVAELETLVKKLMEAQRGPVLQ